MEEVKDSNKSTGWNPGSTLRRATRRSRHHLTDLTSVKASPEKIDISLIFFCIKKNNLFEFFYAILWAGTDYSLDGLTNCTSVTGPSQNHQSSWLSRVLHLKNSTTMFLLVYFYVGRWQLLRLAIFLIWNRCDIYLINMISWPMDISPGLRLLQCTRRCTTEAPGLQSSGAGRFGGLSALTKQTRFTVNTWWKGLFLAKT